MGASPRESLSGRLAVGGLVHKRDIKKCRLNKSKDALSGTMASPIEPPRVYKVFTGSVSGCWEEQPAFLSL
jgi:hypothetical protein